MLGGMTSRYTDLSKEDLVRALERRDARRALGLVWERDRIAQDVAHNSDFVALDLDLALSSPRGPDGGWRNLVIEGDNWDALRTLRLTHTGRVKCILIDPPYNTGNKDFTFNDHYVGKEDRYRQSLWLEFLYRRLLLARDLLTEDGVMLVCINDENRAKLDLLMDQTLPGMRLGSFVWRTKDTNNSDKRRSWSGVHAHDSPHLSDRPENVSEQRLVLQHAGEALHQRTQPDLRHHRDQIVEHAALAEQRMDAALGCVGLEHPVIAQRFAGGAEQRQQYHRKGVDQP
jgi:hypothetical protein